MTSDSEVVEFKKIYSGNKRYVSLEILSFLHQFAVKCDLIFFTHKHNVLKLITNRLEYTRISIISI